MARLESALRKNRSAPPAVQASRLPVRFIPAPRSTFPAELSATVSASKKYVLARELFDESILLRFNCGGWGPQPAGVKLAVLSEGCVDDFRSACRDHQRHARSEHADPSSPYRHSSRSLGIQ